MKTIAEVIQECFRVLLGTSIYKSQLFPELIKARTFFDKSCRSSFAREFKNL
jgi:hypothetical protein